MSHEFSLFSKKNSTQKRKIIVRFCEFSVTIFCVCARAQKRKYVLYAYIVTGISQKLSNVFYFSVSLIGISAGRSTFTTVATARRNPVNR